MNKLEPIFFTQEGFEKLKEELSKLQAKREPTVLRLQAAREMGDLSENGAYKASRFELSDIDRNIRRIMTLLKQAIVKEPRKDGIAGFGSMVTLERSNQKIVYQLVSKFESDPVLRKLSVESPLGQVIVGKSKGEIVTFEAPAGKMEYKILKIE